jgi:hypothetical protein
MNKKEASIMFANWIAENGYSFVKEENMWSPHDLPFLYTTEELYEEFIKC